MLFCYVLLLLLLLLLLLPLPLPLLFVSLFTLLIPQKNMGLPPSHSLFVDASGVHVKEDDEVEED